MTDSESEVSPEVARLVADAADAFQARRARGEEPDPEEYAARYPAAADAIRGVLGVLRHAPIASPDSSLAPQPRVLGDFRIIRQVGRGGMGIVYEAVQISLGRRVALKVLPFAALVDDHLLQRFHTEARAAAGLDHPNVVQVHAVGEERGTHFIAMQFIDGRPLSDLLRDWHGAPTRPAPAGASAPTETYEPGRAGGAGSTRPAEAADRSTLAEVRSTAFFHRAAELAVQAARALAHAHAADVFHRDIKPGNLLVDASRHLWVSDFGLAKMKASDAGLTRTGDVFGTLRYLSPEQAHGQNDQVDGRTDVYALGATLYELLTGHPVVTATERLQILWQVIHDLPVPLRRWNRAIPPDLEAVCLKCLEKDPNRRYQTAGAMADDLGRWMDGLPTVARPLGVWGRSVRRVQRRRSAVLVGALIVGCLGFAGTAAYLGARPPAQTVESGGTDRREGLRELGTAVAKGEPARVIGTTGGPVSKWKEWIVGGGAQFSLDDADLFTIHTQEVALLELLPRVEYDTYELTAEVRHDEATALGCVGLYVGRVAYPRTPNDLHFLVHLTFNAVKADAPVQLPIPGAVQPGWTNRVDLALRLLAEKDVNSHVSLGTRISGPEVPALGKNNNRWFSLAVRVSPDGILATFDGERIELTREKIADLVEKGLPLVRAKHPGDASIQNVRPAFDPRGGLGLYLRYGSAAVRNVIVQRLAPNP